MRRFYLMDVPYVWILHPNLSQQAADVRLEQRPVAVPRGIFCYSDLLVVFPIWEQATIHKKELLFFF